METHSNRIDYIDDLRALAIIMVMIVHTAQSVYINNPLRLEIASFGQMGVQLFFVLSALTLCISINKKEFTVYEVSKFYIRRYFRIAPLYYFGILLYALYAILTNYTSFNGESFYETYNLKNIFSNILFIHGFVRANNSVVPGGWSIGTEMAFYAIFPFLFFYLKSISTNRKRLIICLLLILISGLIINFITLKYGLKYFVYYNLLNQLSVFLVGICFYFYNSNTELYKNNKSITLPLLVFFLLFFFSFISYKYYFNISITPFLVSLAFIFLVYIVSISSYRSLQIIKRTGQLSFSIYIIHFVFAWDLSKIIYELLKESVNTDLIFVLCFFVTYLLSFAFSLITESIIEKHGIEFGRKVTKLVFRQKIAK